MAAKSKPNRRQDRPVRRTFSVRETLEGKLGTDEFERLRERLRLRVKPRGRRRRR